MSGGGSSSSGTWMMRCCLVGLAIASALCVSGPALYWKFNKTMRFKCPPCHCKCPPPISLLTIAPGLSNLSITDLLTEELKLQETVTEEHIHHMNITSTEARKLASQYQMEAEKCNVATQTCEEARERAAALLTKERKVTSKWEKRARQLGWKEE